MLMSYIYTVLSYDQVDLILIITLAKLIIKK